MIFKDESERKEMEKEYKAKVISLAKSDKEILATFKNFKGFERSKVKAKLESDSGDLLWDPKPTK
jgi:hypothetical protein